MREPKKGKLGGFSIGRELPNLGGCTRHAEPLHKELPSHATLPIWPLLPACLLTHSRDWGMVGCPQGTGQVADGSLPEWPMRMCCTEKSLVSHTIMEPSWEPANSTPRSRLHASTVVPEGRKAVVGAAKPGPQERQPGWNPEGLRTWALLSPAHGRGIIVAPGQDGCRPLDQEGILQPDNEGEAVLPWGGPANVLCRGPPGG